MTRYVREATKKLEFEGEEVVVRLKPLLYADLLALRSGGDEAQMMSTYGQMLPRYVTLVTPPRAADGSEVSLDEITSVAYFASLLARIARVHTEDAMLPLASGSASLSASVSPESQTETPVATSAD